MMRIVVQIWRYGAGVRRGGRERHKEMDRSVRAKQFCVYIVFSLFLSLRDFLSLTVIEFVKETTKINKIILKKTMIFFLLSLRFFFLLFSISFFDIYDL